MKATTSLQIQRKPKVRREFSNQQHSKLWNKSWQEMLSYGYFGSDAHFIIDYIYLSCKIHSIIVYFLSCTLTKELEVNITKYLWLVKQLSELYVLTGDLNLIAST